ncbi:EamA family transporter [Angustibacter sp. McL0619]|uniref:EamA family transporter n=1 Tax=Angustibacter sp. McL0619 TaxID=3415676 RepID=UPI003CF47854
MAVVLALLSSVLWGSSDFLGGLRSRIRPAMAVVGGSQLCGLLAITGVALATGAWRADTGWVPWALAAGLAGTAGLVCFYAALAAGTMGVVSPIAALGAVVPVIIGILSGERPSAVSVTGLVIALLGAVLASGPELRGGAGARPVALAALAGIGFGLALVFIERGARFDSVMTLTGMRLTSVTVFVVVAVAMRSLGGLRPSDALPLAVVGLGDVGANLLYALATQRGLLSITAVVGSLYPVVTVLLARFVLHERLARIQQVGVGAALLGVALVALGRT